MADALEAPKFYLSILNKPLCVLMVNTLLASSSSSNCWYAMDKSNLLNKLLLAVLLPCLQCLAMGIDQHLTLDSLKPCSPNKFTETL